jgi:hypothetical protein
MSTGLRIPYLRRKNPFHRYSDCTIEHGKCSTFGSLDRVFIGPTAVIFANQGFSAASLALFGFLFGAEISQKKVKKSLS